MKPNKARTLSCRLALIGLTALTLGSLIPAAAQNVTLLNVSYDPTRELYQDFNAAFARYWAARSKAAGQSEAQSAAGGVKDVNESGT